MSVLHAQRIYVLVLQEHKTKVRCNGKYNETSLKSNTVVEQDGWGSSEVSITGGLEEEVRHTSAFRTQKMHNVLRPFHLCEGQ